MMAPPKKPPTEKELIRLPKAWITALNEDVKESGEHASRAALIRSLIYQRIKARLEKKKR